MAKIMRVARKSSVVWDDDGGKSVFIPEDMTGTVVNVLRIGGVIAEDGDDITVTWDHAFHSEWSEDFDEVKNRIGPWTENAIISKDLRFVGIEESPDKPA